LTKEAEQSMFAPFMTTKPHGLGMGLFICRCLIEQHHGAIRAESSPYGTTLQFTLPLAREDAVAAASHAHDLHR
jgi:signal transduction histidine kinase